MSSEPSSPAPQSASVGVFIVFEGGDGVGKSTQIERASKTLSELGREVLVTREPGGSTLGQKIRGLLLDSEPGSVSDRTEALLFAADRADHVATVITPALARGAVVLCDRYVDSSIAYQGVARGLGVEQVAELSSWATDGLLPDLTIVLDLDPEVGLTRAAQASQSPDRMEQEPLEFHHSVRNAFLNAAALDPSRYEVVDASADLETVTQQVMVAVDAFIRVAGGDQS